MAAGSVGGEIYLFGEAYSEPADNWSENNSSENFEATLTFFRPDGSPLANTTVYYGTSQGQEATELGTTDFSGSITTTDSALAGQTIFFKSSDEEYSGNADISSSGGDVSLTLVETGTAPQIGPPIWLISAVLVGCVAFGVLVFLKRRGRGNSGDWQIEGEPRKQSESGGDVPAIRTWQVKNFIISKSALKSFF